MPESDANKPTLVSSLDLLTLMQSMAADVGVIKADAAAREARDERLEAQQAHIIELHGESMDEVRRLATMFVEVRQRLAALETRAEHSDATAIPMRPRLPSLTGEEREVRDASMRATAQELPRQTELAEQQLKTISDLPRALKSTITRSSKWTALAYLIGTVMSGMIAGAFHGCGH